MTISLDHMVRIGELRVAPAAGGGRLVTVGLGSCVGLALVDERSGVVGLAHVFLPEPPPSGAKPGAGAGTYATEAVPALLDAVSCEIGGPRRRSGLVAVVAGGATMFGGRPGQDVGERNIEAVLSLLDQHGIPVASSDVRGRHGRTMWVESGIGGTVVVRTVGDAPRVVWTGSSMQALEQRAA